MPCFVTGVVDTQPGCGVGKAQVPPGGKSTSTIRPIRTQLGQ